MGVRTSRVKILCFTLTGALSAIAALVQFTHLESISPLSGDQYQLKAIAIAVMGGTALTGGTGTILGTLIGTLIMGVLTTGLVQAGISNYWFRTFMGLIIILAVLMNGRMQKLLRVAS
jgi:simple sugar transport system permease protein